MKTVLLVWTLVLAAACGGGDDGGGGMCLPEGGDCSLTGADGCCSDTNCMAGTCEICVADGTTCASNLECCSNVCGMAGTGSCRRKAAGEPCDNHRECQSGDCDKTNYVCQ